MNVTPSITTQTLKDSGIARDDPWWVAVWRRDYALQLGFDDVQAALIAATRTLDLHEIEKLTSRGCPPLVALEIVR